MNAGLWKSLMRTSNPAITCTLQHIEYAKSKSYATLKREDPNFVPPTSVHAQNNANRFVNGTLGGAGRDDRMDEDERSAKRAKIDDDDGEEMEIEDDDDTAAKGPGALYLLAYLNLACSYRIRCTTTRTTSISPPSMYKPTTRGHG